MRLLVYWVVVFGSVCCAFHLRLPMASSWTSSTLSKLNMAKNKGSKFVTDDILNLVREHQGEIIAPIANTLANVTQNESMAVVGKKVNEAIRSTDATPTKDDKNGESITRLQFGATGDNRLKHVMMGLKKVTMSFGDKQVLKDASFTVSSGEKVGLVGPNGSGKTLQLQILNGDIEPDSGEVLCSSSSVAVAFLRQEFSEELSADYTVKDELFQVFPEEFEIYQQLHQLNQTLADLAANGSESKSITERYQTVHRDAINRGIFELETRILTILNETGFTSQDVLKYVSDFSGGWKMRIGLAKIFLQEPNILFLDEPTNHLDLDSVMWLESFLVKEKIPMVIVSHDREFLNRVCNKMIDLEDGITKTYRGNYAEYLAHKKADQAAWLSRYSKQCIEVANLQSYIRRFKPELHMAQAVANKETVLKKLMESPDFLVEPPKERKYRFKFPEPPKSDTVLYEAHRLGHQFTEDRVLFRNLDLLIRRGNRVGLVGPNGAGKSTLARIVAGLEQPTSGVVSHRDHRLQIGYFAQNQADALDPDMTIHQIVREAAPPGMDPTELRGLLGQFMFRANDGNKKVEVLSGGEKARVALCKMLLKPANLLILDEPTNHLDINSKEALEDALAHYTGAVIVISHDRYFMSQVANSIISFDGRGSATFYDCDYYDYLHKQDGISADVKEIVQSRKVAGNYQELTRARAVIAPKVQEDKKKKNFGGSGVTSGNLFKGVKNAKRFSQVRGFDPSA